MFDTNWSSFFSLKLLLIINIDRPIFRQRFKKKRIQKFQQHPQILDKKEGYVWYKLKQASSFFPLKLLSIISIDHRTFPQRFNTCKSPFLLLSKKFTNSLIPPSLSIEDVTKSRCAAFSIGAQSVKVREAERNEKKEKKNADSRLLPAAAKMSAEEGVGRGGEGKLRWGQDAFQSAVTRGCQRGASNRAFGESGAGTRLFVSASFIVTNVSSSP